MKSKSGITLQFIPYAELAYLTSYQRVKKLIDLAVQDRVLLIQGRLAPEEETDLIRETMRHIRESKKSKFKGIELATFTPQVKNLSLMQSLRENFAKSLLGERDVLTVIGPATLVKEIKKDPAKIQLLLRK